MPAPCPAPPRIPEQVPSEKPESPCRPASPAPETDGRIIQKSPSLKEALSPECRILSKSNSVSCRAVSGGRQRAMAAPLRFWVLTTAGPASVQPISRMIEAFSRRSGVPVELRAIPWGRGWRALTRAIKRRDLPDVMHIGSTWIATLAHLDLLAEAPRGVWTQPTVAPWVDEAALAGGVAWAVPWTVECNVLIGRTDLLEAAGVAPEEFSDWDGFLQVCRRLDG